MATLGIDPGGNGAVAICDDNNAIHVWDVPAVKLKIGKTVKLRLDLTAYLDLIEGVAMMFSPELAVIEDVGGLPGQSAPAAFTFGFTTGCQVAGLVAARIPFIKVKPSVWKKQLGVPADKDATRFAASQIIPQGHHHWPLVKHDGRAEAALLAVYAKRHLTGSYHNGKSAEVHATH